MKLYGGIDLHSNNSVIALLDEEDKVVARIGDPTLRGRSYHLDLCQQVPESDSIFLRDGSKEGRKRRFKQTRARYCEGTAAEGRAGRKGLPAPALPQPAV